jgi:hypothetical protein
MSSKLLWGVVAAALGALAYAAPPPAGVVPPSVNPMAIQPATHGPASIVSQAAFIGSEDCVPVDAAKLHIMGMGPASFMVMEGAKPFLVNFPNKLSAEHAVHIIQSYQFDQKCHIGAFPLAFMYWKSAGHVPSNMLPGELCTPVEPANVTVAAAGENWAVMQGGATLAAFHGDKAVADRARTLIKAYSFRHKCMSNMPNAVMTYWLTQ